MKNHWPKQLWNPFYFKHWEVNEEKTGAEKKEEEIWKEEKKWDGEKGRRDFESGEERMSMGKRERGRGNWRQKGRVNCESVSVLHIHSLVIPFRFHM